MKESTDLDLMDGMTFYSLSGSTEADTVLSMDMLDEYLPNKVTIK